KMQPFNNSMYGISMLLKRYGVKNECIRFENKESVDDGDVPFLAIVKGVFVIVDEVSAKSVRVTYDSGTTERYDRKAFMEQWNGVALMATVGPESGEPDYEKHLQGWHVLQLKRVALVACLLVVAAIGIASGRSTWSIGMAVAMLLNVAGCYVSYLLMLKQLHLPSRVAERLCGLTGHDGGCDKVAASDGSTLLGVAKLSEVGAGFFGVNVLALTLLPEMAGAVAIAALCVLPFTLWSVWHQRFKVKAWCALCLCVSGIMWLQALAFAAGGYYAPYAWQGYSAWGFVGLVAGYGAAILGLNALLPVVGRALELPSWRNRYDELRLDDKVVGAINATSPQVDVSASASSSLIFGNKDASHMLTVFSNPYCGPCALMHDRIVRSLSLDECAVQYVFTSFSPELAVINRYFISAYEKMGPEATWQLMTRWYAGGKEKGEAFFDGMGLDAESPSVKAEADKHKAWAKNDILNGTPTLMVDGRLMPTEYAVEDVAYFS
ncbi:MAG: thioredoxin domain-containing protein, partial [Prevotella sp.]|nr:thioredoxin domain-containing protein [Prevotella sp.]